MSKVLVDRELLEQCVELLDLLPESRTVVSMRELLAKPAEAEGVQVVAFAHERTGAVATADAVKFMEAGSVSSGYTIALMTVTQYLAALSAVTAERDRLREQCRIHDMLHGTKGRERVAALLAQNEALRSFVTECAETAGGMVNGNKLSHRAKELIAAMAAKEA